MPLRPTGLILRCVSGLTVPLRTFGKLITRRPILASGLADLRGIPDASDVRGDASSIVVKDFRRSEVRFSGTNFRPLAGRSGFFEVEIAFTLSIGGMCAAFGSTAGNNVAL